MHSRLEIVGAVAVGALGALGFPLVIPAISSTPCLEGGPREIFVWLLAAALYGLYTSSRPKTQKRLLALAAGCGHFAVLLYWLVIAMTRFGGMPLWQSVVVLGVMVAYCALYFVVLGEAFEWLARYVPGACAKVAFALAVVGVEWWREHLLTGFTWGFWGYSLTRVSPLLQWASVLGVYGLSFCIALFGAWWWETWRFRQQPRAWRRGGLSVALLAVLVLGGVALEKNGGLQNSKALRVAIAQGNIEQSVINDGLNRQAQIVERYVHLSEQARRLTPVPELIVWPEAAYPGYVSTAQEFFPSPLPAVWHLIGTPSYAPPAALQPSHLYNSVIAVSPTRRIEGFYHKQHLVPFGEYVPLRSVLPFERFVPGAVDFSAAVGQRPISPWALGVLICFDGVFAEIARDLVNQGALALVNVTNDGWYGISSAPYQHLDFYRLRAVENRRYVVRAANNGISAFINAQGEVIAQTQLNRAAVLDHTLYLGGNTSIYGAGGFVFAPLCAALVACMGMVAGGRFMIRCFARGSPRVCPKQTAGRHDCRCA